MNLKISKGSWKEYLIGLFGGIAITIIGLVWLAITSLENYTPYPLLTIGFGVTWYGVWIIIWIIKFNLKRNEEISDNIR